MHPLIGTDGSCGFWEETMIEPFFISDMQTAHNGYAGYCLAEMLQCSYVTVNGNNFLPTL